MLVAQSPQNVHSISAPCTHTHTHTHTLILHLYAVCCVMCSIICRERGRRHKHPHTHTPTPTPTHLPSHTLPRQLEVSRTSTGPNPRENKTLRPSNAARRDCVSWSIQPASPRLSRATSPAAPERGGPEASASAFVLLY